MTRIDIEDIRKIESEIDRLNKLDLSQVELYIANEKIVISDKIIADWKFTGLNNYHFFKDEFYLEKPSLLDQLESGPWPKFVQGMKEQNKKCTCGEIPGSNWCEKCQGFFGGFRK